MWPGCFTPPRDCACVHAHRGTTCHPAGNRQLCSPLPTLYCLLSCRYGVAFKWEKGEEGQDDGTGAADCAAAAQKHLASVTAGALGARRAVVMAEHVLRQSACVCCTPAHPGCCGSACCPPSADVRRWQCPAFSGASSNGASVDDEYGEVQKQVRWPSRGHHSNPLLPRNLPACPWSPQPPCLCADLPQIRAQLDSTAAMMTSLPHNITRSQLFLLRHASRSWLITLPNTARCRCTLPWSMPPSPALPPRTARQAPATSSSLWQAWTWRYPSGA